MQGTHLPITWSHPGGDDADKLFATAFPFPVQLVGVSARCSDSTSFILDIGINDDPDALLDEKTVTGHATNVTQYGRSDFVGGEYPHIAPNVPISINIDHDGGDGNDGLLMAVTLIFTEG